MGSVVDNFTEITGTLGDLLNITQQNIENEKGSAIEEIDEQNTYNNPTMRSMLSLHYYLERLKYEEDERKTKADIKVKLEICDTMDFLINMRKNYLISNYLAWYQKLGLKMEKYIETEKFDQKLSKKVTKAFATIIPPVAKTGIFEIDEEFIPKAEDVLNFNILKKVETKKVLKFTHYVKDPNDHPDFVPDIDTLLLGDANQYEDVTSEILPTLLITFLNTKDNDLEMRLLDIIMRLFNQRTELFDSLKKLEILFEPAEKKSYEFVERLSSKLKGLTEKIEVLFEHITMILIHFLRFGLETIFKELEDILNCLKQLCLFNN